MQNSKTLKTKTQVDDNQPPLPTQEVLKGKVVSEMSYGFLVALQQNGTDLDAPSEILMPFMYAHNSVVIGKTNFFYVFFDEKTERVLATTQFYKFLPEHVSPDAYSVRQAVNVKVYEQSDLGFKVIINDEALGLIFHSDALQDVQLGREYQGFIKAIRDEDGKIDVSMHDTSVEGRDALQQKILDLLDEFNGILTVTDKSTPGEIQHTFGVSKGAYKKALGALYKQKLITINPDYVKRI